MSDLSSVFVNRLRGEKKADPPSRVNERKNLCFLQPRIYFFYPQSD